MATHLNRDPLRWLVALAALAVIAVAGWWGWDRYRTDYAETTDQAGGPGATQIVSARLSGANSLKVAELNGTVQSTASAIRGFGWLRSDQVVKMPYSVDYFVELARIDERALSWNPETRTMIVDSPDVTVGAANTDEGRRTLVRTTGLFVSRGAAEQLSRATSLRASQAATREARSPERMAQAREKARAAVAEMVRMPLAATGLGDVRVVVTFPPERSARSDAQWDRSRTVTDVLANTR